MDEFIIKGIDEYQNKIKETDVSNHELDFYLDGMVEELGEIAGVLKRIKRGDYNKEMPFSVWHQKIVPKLIEEGGDLAWYFNNFFNHMNIRMSFVLSKNIEKTQRRYKQGKILGEGKR